MRAGPDGRGEAAIEGQGPAGPGPGPGPQPDDDLERFLDERLPYADRTTERFLPVLADHPGVVAVVYYGSCLSSIGASDSEPDFYVIVDSLKDYCRRPGQRLLGQVLPPLTLHRTLPPSGFTDERRTCKVCVVSASQLREETGAGAADLHHLGRFSKRIGLVHWRDHSARTLVRHCQRSALEILAQHALALLGDTFSVDEFMLALLGLSYRGEPRVAEPGKVERIFDSDRDSYGRIGEMLLRAHKTRVEAISGARYRQAPASPEALWSVHRLIARSRRRALLRWPKNMLTFDGWADYAIRKVERHTGHALMLSPRARKHPLLFGWPVLFGLRRSGVLR